MMTPLNEFFAIEVYPYNTLYQNGAIDQDLTVLATVLGSDEFDSERWKVITLNDTTVEMISCTLVGKTAIFVCFLPSLFPSFDHYNFVINIFQFRRELNNATDFCWCLRNSYHFLTTKLPLSFQTGRRSLLLVMSSSEYVTASIEIVQITLNRTRLYRETQVMPHCQWLYILCTPFFR